MNKKCSIVLKLKVWVKTKLVQMNIYFSAMNKKCSIELKSKTSVKSRPVTRGGCKGTDAPPFLLKRGYNDEFAPPPPFYIVVWHNLLLKNLDIGI